MNTEDKKSKCRECPHADREGGVVRKNSLCKLAGRSVISMCIDAESTCPLGHWKYDRQAKPLSPKKQLKTGCGTCKKAAELRKQRRLKND